MVHDHVHLNAHPSARCRRARCPNTSSARSRSRGASPKSRRLEGWLVERHCGGSCRATTRATRRRPGRRSRRRQPRSRSRTDIPPSLAWALLCVEKGPRRLPCLGERQPDGRVIWCPQWTTTGGHSARGRVAASPRRSTSHCAWTRTPSRPWCRSRDEAAAPVELGRCLPGACTVAP